MKVCATLPFSHPYPHFLVLSLCSNYCCYCNVRSEIMGSRKQHDQTRSYSSHHSWWYYRPSHGQLPVCKISILSHFFYIISYHQITPLSFLLSQPCLFRSIVANATATEINELVSPPPFSYLDFSSLFLIYFILK